MPLDLELQRRVFNYVEEERDQLIKIISELVRIPSENTPPRGAEQACQQYIAERLTRLGWQPELYDVHGVPGIKEHPLYFPGRDYTARPNLGARRKGVGEGGRSLVLSGHIDTVPRGSEEWRADPFSGHVDGNYLYGRGSSDMKGGIGTNLFVIEAIERLNLPLQGELVFESVVDEEFGGANGTLAGRLAGFNADAAIISEPSSLRICPAQRGGCTAHIVLRAPGGILRNGTPQPGVVDQLAHLLGEIRCFGEQRRRAVKIHPLYAENPDAIPVSVGRIFTAPWGMHEPMTVPEVCKVELYWQLMPGESLESARHEFFHWFESMLARMPELFRNRPEVEFPIRWLPGSAISTSEPLVRELAECATGALGYQPTIAGIEGPCDMFVFHQGFGIPAVLWGASGGNAHGADEYLQIDSVVAAAKALLFFICRWCGLER